MTLFISEKKASGFHKYSPQMMTSFLAYDNYKQCTSSARGNTRTTPPPSPSSPSSSPMALPDEPPAPATASHPRRTPPSPRRHPRRLPHLPLNLHRPPARHHPGPQCHQSSEPPRSKHLKRLHTLPVTVIGERPPPPRYAPSSHTPGQAPSSKISSSAASTLPSPLFFLASGSPCRR